MNKKASNPPMPNYRSEPPPIPQVTLLYFELPTRFNDACREILNIDCLIGDLLGIAWSIESKKDRVYYNHRIEEIESFREKVIDVLRPRSTAQLPEPQQCR